MAQSQPTGNKPLGLIESLTQRIENLEQLIEDQARELEQLRAEVAWRDGKNSEVTAD